MKNYYLELIVLLIQIFMFYIFPLFAGPTDAMGMVFLILLSTFTLAIIMGIFSKNKFIWIYPLVISIIFIPTIFIYYNLSALIHSIWYFIDSLLGILIGKIFSKVFK